MKTIDCSMLLRRGLKARKSIAQGKALWHERRQSLTETPTGRNPFASIAPFQGWLGGIFSFRRAMPCANDYPAFSRLGCNMKLKFNKNSF
jgi:hypothetical protein